MKKLTDAYGQLLWDYFKDKDGTNEIVERDDNFIASGGYGGKVYFSTYKDWAPLEKQAMKYARGRVLDVGCGAGRHSLYLQGKRFDVTGIDTSSLAIKICKARGLRKARVLSFGDIDKFKKSSFDTVLMMGNNFGLFEGFQNAKKHLKKLYDVVSENGSVVAIGTNPKTKNPIHSEYQKFNRGRGRMSGQLRIRIRYKNLVGPWFDYLLASKEEIEEILVGTHWKISKFSEKKGGRYIVVLKKK